MNNKTPFLVGILGVSLFAVSSILGGFLIKNYSIIGQYISELYAIDTEYGTLLRIFGIIPSGIFITVFCFLAVRYFQPSKLLKLVYGIGIFYGLATVVVGIFPCDSGCNKELIDPSASQLIHNFVGLLTYLFVPVFMILIGIRLKKLSNYNTFSLQSIALGTIGIILVNVLVAKSNSGYIGLYQRMIELVFVMWILFCAVEIKDKNPVARKV
ncbi:MAG: hypothetical protein CMC08_10210 [Flavobacteriaceae bacterium]|nr:hypothetical protein [Flavobacteriaceae bacterium]|tara:strand:+ start:47 stop:682 length:636 start_codon:yes stop_codon:yes gene_type:complete